MKTIPRIFLAIVVIFLATSTLSSVEQLTNRTPETKSKLDIELKFEKDGSYFNPVKKAYEREFVVTVIVSNQIEKTQNFKRIEGLFLGEDGEILTISKEKFEVKPGEIKSFVFNSNGHTRGLTNEFNGTPIGFIVNFYTKNGVVSFQKELNYQNLNSPELEKA